jgi:hypothetical protein
MADSDAIPKPDASQSAALRERERVETTANNALKHNPTTQFTARKNKTPFIKKT